MSIVTHKNWTLTRKDEICTLRQYKHTTILRGDDARHGGTELARFITVSLDGLAQAIRDLEITEFCDEENMAWLLSMPVETEGN